MNCMCVYVCVCMYKYMCVCVCVCFTLEREKERVLNKQRKIPEYLLHDNLEKDHVKVTNEWEKDHNNKQNEPI